MKNVDYAFFLTAFVATIGALIVTAVNEASFNISLVLLTFALVLITCIYAMRTVDIAKANREMAEEMKEQRYDAVRPVIDIQVVLEGVAAISAGLAAESEDFAWGLSCILHNIGLGPAIDVYSFVQVQKNERRCWDFGTLAKDQKTDNPESLSVNKKGGRNYVAVYYKDVFGRNFESSREVKPTKEKTALEIGPLKPVLAKESKPK
jgi:hypothetical protein